MPTWPPFDYRRAADQGDMAAHQKLLAAGALGRSADYGRLKTSRLAAPSGRGTFTSAPLPATTASGRCKDYAEAARLYLEAARPRPRAKPKPIWA